MRMLVMFDLPTLTKPQKKKYSQFRKFLIGDGFIMIQFSVYSRYCKNSVDAGKHAKRSIDNSPSEGSIRILQVTERQYEDMLLVIGERKESETKVGKDYTIII